jgi:hypothetical protein
MTQRALGLHQTLLTEYAQTRTVLNVASAYTSTPLFLTPPADLYTPTSSGLNTYVKSLWRPFASVQSYYFTLSTVADFLSKREYLYRQFLEHNSRVTFLPNDLRATANNTLLEEVERSYNFNDPIAVQGEVAREVYYYSTPLFKFLLIAHLRDALLNLPINTTALYELLNFYGLGAFDGRKNVGT